MSEPAVRLDPRQYQDLVDEARVRVGQRCPDWTDHNVSDPGMTLIDQFAWMTDILLYRVNRIPDRVYEALLALLGVQLEPPLAATTKLRFLLAAPPAEPVPISAGFDGADGRSQPATEVATPGDDGRPAVVFQVRTDTAVPVLRLAAVALWRAGRPEPRRMTTVEAVDGVVRLRSDDRHVFSSPPRSDDALYFGFDTPIANVVVQLHVGAIPARGTNIDPDDAPWLWEVCRPDGTWQPRAEEDPVEVLAETTGGFNYESGTVELQVPEQSGVTEIAGQRKHWLRCRPRKAGHRADDPQAYLRAPQVVEIRANAIGVLADAHHAMRVEREELGVSDGTAGQTFRVRHAPALELGPGETVQVEVRSVDREERAGDAASRLSRAEEDAWDDWERRESLHESGPADRHFRFDPSTGEVLFGVGIKVRDYGERTEGASAWHQHGAVPPAGTRVRMSRYRHGGGDIGNADAGTLTQLRTPIPGVASVTNPKPARGGLDGETLAAAQHRAADMLRIRRRAVTADDFEHMALNASPQIVRARCIAPEVDARRFPESLQDERVALAPNRADRRDPWPRSAVQVCVLAQVHDPHGYIPPDELRAPRELREAVAQRLEERCLIGTSAHVTPVAFREVTVTAEVRIAVSADVRDVQWRVVRALHRYINPFVGGDPLGESDGWDWGDALDVAQLVLLVDSIDGVRDVLAVRAFETGLPPRPGDFATYREIDGRLEIGPHELVASGRHEARAHLAVP